MMTVEALSERILDETFLHSDISGEYDEENLDIISDVGTDDFAHYGVKGMKWGVRKKREPAKKETPRQKRARLDKIAKENAERKHKENLAKAAFKAEAQAQKRALKSQEKIRKMELKAEKEAREAETDQQKKERLDRESRERMAEADRKAREKEQKRSIKSQEKLRKAELKGQADREAAARKDQLKNQTKLKELDQKAQSDREKRLDKQLQRQEKAKLKAERKNSVLKKHQPQATMSDKDLSDAINRLRNEKAYQDLKKKPDGLAKKALKAAVFGIAVPVGMAVVKKQLTNLGDDYLEKQGSKVRKKFNIPKTVKKGTTLDEVAEMLERDYGLKKG